MDGFAYEMDPLDPQEEERKRQAALEALAAAGNPAPEPVDRAAPVELAPEVMPRTAEPGQLDITGSPNMLPEPTPAEIPDPGHPEAAFAALAAAGRDNEATETVPDNEAAEGEAPPPGSAPAKGLDSASASPEMKEVVNPDQGTKKTEPPPAPDPFEALMQRGEEQRRAQLEEYDKRGAPGVNGWALLADVAFNHGRSIPGILSQADADKRSFEEGRRKLMAGGAHTDPVNQMLAMKRLELTDRGLNQGAQRLTAAEEKAQRAAEQNKSDTAAFLKIYDKVLSDDEKESLRDASPAAFRTMAGMFRQKYGNLESTQQEAARGEGLKAGARTTSTINAENAGKDIKADTVYTTETARRKAEAEQLGTRPETPAQIAAREHQEGRDAESDRRAREAEARAARIEQRTNETLSATRQQTFGKSVEKALPVAKELEKVEGLIAGYKAKGEPVPGVGIGGHKSAAESSLMPQAGRDLYIELSGDPKTRAGAIAATSVRGYISNFEQDLIHNRSGAAFNANEEQMNKITAGSRVGAPLEAVEAALQAIHEIVQTKIGGFASVAPAEAHSFMKAAGLTPGRWGIQEPVQQMQPSAAGSDLTPGQSFTTDPETGDQVIEGAGADVPKPPKLKVTGGARSKVAPIPAQPPAARDYQKMLEEDDDLGVTYGR